ncbi:MAG: creatininase family protein [Armatimonadetes bacterium]|nr:creatininase family protein [Armatimonadota bacterium]
MVDWKNTSPEIGQAKPEYAIIPIGAIEQHSSHLPVGTDFLICKALAARVAEELGSCYLLPTLPYSCSREHFDFPGTVWVRPETLGAIVEDLVGALHHQGITKIALLIGHGGNWICKPKVRELNLDRKGFHVIVTAPEGLTTGAGEFDDLHAGGGETALILHLDPDLVKMDQMKPDFAPTQGREFIDYVGMGGVTPAGHWGPPSQGTAEKGAQILEHATKSAVDYIRNTFAEIERIEAERASS